MSVMFVNLGIQDTQMLAAARYDEAMRHVDDALIACQRAVESYDGSINKARDPRNNAAAAARVRTSPPLSSSPQQA